MKINISWLKELVDLNCSLEELTDLLTLRSVSIKEVTGDYIELDMKGYNRADLLSMRGVAYEIAAVTGSKLLFNEPEEANFVWNQQELPNTRVKIENQIFCPFYTVTKIEGLSVGKSPAEWVKRLGDSGMRSVDNTTDITNLIMLEFGQPMHAFDVKGVKDEAIMVRTAKQGERITTLDGKNRDLEVSDLLITDSSNTLGIAGIMGGKDSEITYSTTTILLEAAIFDQVNIRRTATRLGLPSEASKRFQHGLTRKRLLQALDTTIRMYEQLGGKITAVTMVGNYEDKVRKITLTKKKLEELVGIKFENKQVEDYLIKLHFKVTSHMSIGNVVWEVEPPYWRLDIELEEDLIEEVVRMYGYEKIPAEVVSESKPLQSEDPIFQKIANLRKNLVNLGLTEVQTYSFYSTDVLNSFDFMNSMKDALVKVANPISSETEYLRQSIWPNLVEVVGKNIRKGFKNISIFEIGKAFNVGSDGNPTENYRLAIALMNGSDNPLVELYRITQDLVDNLGVKLIHPGGVQERLFHPKRQIGNLAEVHLRVLNKMGIEKRVAVFEITL